jgi:hypothetical protein
MQPGFKCVRGNVIVAMGVMGTRKVVGFNPNTEELLLRDETRQNASPFIRHISKVAVDKEKILSHCNP